MILVGRHLSPFGGRVAVTLRLYGFHYEHRGPLMAFGDDKKTISQWNPLGRVALLLDDGEVLFDSGAILDYMAQRAGPERALIPPSGPARREVLRLMNTAIGAAEKTAPEA